MLKQQMLKMSDEEALKHIICYDALPGNFDLNTAEPRVLRKYGIPRRPDAEKELHLRRLWDRALASKPTFIKAEVAVDHILSKRKRPVLNKKLDTVDFSPSGWGGVVVPVSQFNYNPPEPVNTVYGEWFIPTVTPITNEPPGSQTVGF